MSRYRFLDSKGEHLHTLDGKPLIGTSTALKVLAKPLTWWASGLAVAELGWLNAKLHAPEARLENVKKHLEKIKAMEPEEFVKLLDTAYAAHSKTLGKAAKDGTDMHAELEKYVRWCIAEFNGAPEPYSQGNHVAVEIFATWAAEHVSRFIASEVHCYSEELWTGGIVDLVFEDKEGRTAIMDFKSAKDAYQEHFFQCAGYDIEISENGVLDADGNELFRLEQPISYYAVFPFGKSNPEPMLNFDTESCKKAFRAAVELHKIINQ